MMGAPSADIHATTATTGGDFRAPLDAVPSSTGGTFYFTAQKGDGTPAVFTVPAGGGTATVVFAGPPLGIGMLTLGIIYHLEFMRALRRTRAEMAAEGLVHGESPFPPSLTLITALVLLAIGIAAIVSMVS